MKSFSSVLLWLTVIVLGWVATSCSSSKHYAGGFGRSASPELNYAQLGRGDGKAVEPAAQASAVTRPEAATPALKTAKASKREVRMQRRLEKMMDRVTAAAPSHAKASKPVYATKDFKTVNQAQASKGTKALLLDNVVRTILLILGILLLAVVVIQLFYNPIGALITLAVGLVVLLVIYLLLGALAGA